MNIRLLKTQDTQKLEEYIAPHKAYCMFICSNLKAGGIEYKGAVFQGEYFGYFKSLQELEGLIVHYWNGNIIMFAQDLQILSKLIDSLKNNMNRPIAGILGPNDQAEFVIKKLELSRDHYSINRNEELYEIDLVDLNEFRIPNNMEAVLAQDVSKNILIEWMKSYDIEALGVSNDEALEKRAEEHWNRRLQKNDSWVLLLEGTPVALSAFNARLTDMNK